MSRPLYYANGMNSSAAKKVALGIFGTFFREIEVDNEKRMFNFIINEYIEEKGELIYFKDRYPKEYRDWFKEFWGQVPGFNLVIIEMKKVKLED